MLDLDGDYYWDTILGSDLNPGTQILPFQTVDVLIDAISIAPGTHLHFRRGVGQNYGEVNAPAFDGTSGNPIVMQTWGSGILPVFTAAVDAVIDLGGNNWWTVQNLRLTGGLQPGLNKTVGGGVFCDNSTGVVLDRLFIDNCFGAGVLAKQVATFTVRSCSISEITGDGGGGHGDGITIRPSADKSVLSTDVVINGNTVGGAIERQGITIIGANRVTITGNTVNRTSTVTGGQAISLEPNVDSTVTNITISGNTVDVLAGAGIGVGGHAVGATVSNFTITKNNINVNNSAAFLHGITLRSTDGTAAQNMVSENLITGTHYGVLVTGAGTQVTVKHNRISGPHAASQSGVYVTDSGFAEIFGNVISEGESGIVVFGGTSEAVVYNNTIVGWRGDYGIGNWVTMTVRNCVLYAMAGNSGLMIRNHGTLDIDYNCYYDEDDDATWRLNATTYTSFVTWQAAVSDDANSFEADPLLSNVAAGDYWLRLGSPAIDVGLTLADTFQFGLDPDSIWPAAVVLANQNDEGTGWEIGAYIFEFESSSSSSSPSSPSSSSSSSPAVDVCPAGKSMSIVGPAGSTLAVPV